jgi:Na+/proline symporter
MGHPSHGPDALLGSAAHAGVDVGLLGIALALLCALLGALYLKRSQDIEPEFRASDDATPGQMNLALPAGLVFAVVAIVVAATTLLR